MAKAPMPASGRAVGIGALCLVYFLASLGLSRHYSAALSLRYPGLIIQVVLSLTGLFIATMAHEYGHFLGGFAVGWRLTGLGIGPWEWVRTPEGWRYRRARRLLGGFVAHVPSTVRGFRWKWAVTVAGGLLSSVAFYVVAVGAVQHARSPLIYWVASSAATWSFLTFLLAGLPWREAFKSDMWRLIEIARGAPDVDLALARHLLRLTLETPLRPAAWPAAPIARAAEFAPAPAHRGLFTYLAYLRAVDSGEPLAAAAHLSRLLETADPAEVPELPLEAAWFLARHARNLESARAWFERAPSTIEEPWLVLRARAALAFGEGRPAEAAQLARQALEAIAGHPPSGAMAYETARAEELLAST